MGDPGAIGPTGQAGPMGSMGSMGSPGQSVVASSEPPGGNCAGGGVKLVSASGTAFVCNGASPTIDYSMVIANGTTPQSASFNVTGTGVVGNGMDVSGGGTYYVTTDHVVDIQGADAYGAARIIMRSNGAAPNIQFANDGSTPNTQAFLGLLHTGSFAPYTGNVLSMGPPGDATTMNTLNFSSIFQHTPDGNYGVAEISNDTGFYKALLLAGNRSAAPTSPTGTGRRVVVIDELDVLGQPQGTLVVGGDTNLNGNLAVTGNASIGVHVVDCSAAGTTSGDCFCANNETVINGGGTGGPAMWLYESRPLRSSDSPTNPAWNGHNGWRLHCANAGGDNPCNAYVITCARLAP
jgi:hypothetical protein